MDQPRGEKLPRKDPLVKKSYFQTLTSNGPSADFSRHAYELVDKADGAILVHYMGDEKAAEGFSHGNSKHCERMLALLC